MKLKQSVRTWLAIGAVTPMALVLALPARAAAGAPGAHQAAPAKSLIPRATGPKTRLIVMLKDDESGLGARSAVRAHALASEETPLASELRAAGATVETSGSAIAYLVASVSSSQEPALRANPLVRLVVPDVEIHASPPQSPSAVPATTRAGSSTKSARPSVSPSICGTAANPEVDPEAITSAAINSVGANELGYDGAGVTVAYIAGGIDPTIPDFQRNPSYASAGSPAGSPVLTPVNFSGDPSSNQGGDASGESFLDASSIAAQGNTVYNLNNYVNSSHPLENPCDIKITGAAPGANVLGIDVFSNQYDTPESNFLQAINYAVHAGVKVLNESFGSNNFPDTALDATRIADDDAVAAGVTVVASSGDSGIGNTLGSPATDPKVISAGASTTFRMYEQDTYGGINATTPNSGDGSWIDNNVSNISSSGFSISGGNTVDLLAPGDLNWIECSTNAEWASECDNENGTASPFTESGGTSEAAPLTSGAAADVIQAYASTHGGTDPSPALIKQILMSTATDVDAPAEQQGAGLLNVLAAVKEATSLPGTSGTQDGGLLASPNQINVVQAPKASTSKTISVTNTGSSPVTVNVSTRALTHQVTSTTGSFCLNPSSATIAGCGPPTANTFAIWSGVTEVYQEETFSVPATTSPSRLDFVADYPVDDPEQASLMHVALFNPSGAYAGYSLPQGLADYANVQVADPAAGTWTAVFFTEQDASSSHGTSGVIQYRATTWEFASAGKISPSSLTIGVGKTETATLRVTSPASSGDTSQSIVLSTAGATNTIPVTVRTTVPLGKNGGTFSGILTGGNGRGTPTATSIYAFDVPTGLHDLDLSASFKDVDDVLVGYLIDPEGEAVAQSSNLTTNSAISATLPTGAVNLYKDDPQAGQWELLFQWLEPVSGAELAEPFSGTIRFNQVSVHSGLPHSPYAELAPGKSYTFDVTVKNTGISPEAYFLDPRTSKTATVRLTDISSQSDQNMSLPLSPGEYPYYIVPADSTGIVAKITGSQPVTFDVEPFPGDPDLSPAVPAPGVTESQSGDSASLRYRVGSGEVESGVWYLNPSEIGPYGSSGAPSATASASFSAITPAFATNVTSPTGDLWRDPSFTPDYVKPGKSVTIRVTVKVTAPAGSVVSGSVKVDDTFLYDADIGVAELNGDELASLPFSYKVASTKQGYDLASSAGKVFHFGAGKNYGSVKTPHASPVVAMAQTPDHGGYLLVTAVGKVFRFGDARSDGSLKSAPSVPIVGIASDATGLGYWLVDAHGRVRSFGDAKNWGSEKYSAVRSNVVGMAPTSNGRGYWLVTSKGNVIRFGDAHNYGAAVGKQFSGAIAGIATTPDGKGYYLVSAGGTVLSFGDAKAHGSIRGHPDGTVVGIATPPSGSGYWVFSSTRQVYSFGSASSFGVVSSAHVSIVAGSSANS